MKSQYKVYREIGKHPCPCRPILASIINPFTYFLKLLRVFPLCRILIEFSLTCMFHHLWGTLFNFMVFTFLENALNRWICTHAAVSQSKLQVEFFEILFPPIRKGWRKLSFALLKYIIRKYQDDLEH